MLDEMICIKISQMIAPRPTAVADTPALDHGETDDNPIPEPSARSNNESAAATKPPAMMAAHDTPEECASLPRGLIAFQLGSRTTATGDAMRVSSVSGWCLQIRNGD